MSITPVQMESCLVYKQCEIFFIVVESYLIVNCVIQFVCQLYYKGYFLLFRSELLMLLQHFVSSHHIGRRVQLQAKVI